MKITILVGLPGAGKTTWTKLLDGSATICSADDYHVKDGVYEYQPELVSGAHELCLAKFIDVLHLDPRWTNHVAVDNTNLELQHLVTYYNVARSLGHRLIQAVHIVANPSVAFERQTHGVPAETFARMYDAEKDLVKNWPTFIPRVVID